jgi:4-hydroxyphenylpyruvate dioxygenase
MKLTLATTCLAGPLVRRLQAAAHAGFGGIEFFWRDCRDSGLSMREIGNVTRDLGLRVETLQPIRGYEGDRGSIREASEAAALQIMEDALELGAPKVGLCANEKESASGIEDAIEEIRELADSAQQLGLELAFEALTWSTQIKDLSQAWEVVRRANRGNLGLVIDSFHIGARGNDPHLIRSIPPAKISMLQVSNAAANPSLPWIEISRHHRSLPDDGAFPVADIVACSLDTGYDGAISVEIFSDAFRQRDAFPVAVECHASLRRIVDAQ